MILLLGHTGYVGRAFERALRARQLPFQAFSRERGDLSESAVLETLISDVSPEFVINAAGWPGTPNVDATETQRARCLRSNVLLPIRLWELCQDRNIPLGHVSTGCIFRGSHPDGSGFTEEDPPNFDFSDPTAGWYSGCKGLAEDSLKRGGSVYIWRLRMPFDHQDDTRNLLSKYLRYAKLLEARNSLSHLGDFVDTCLNSWLNGIPYGIYNVTNAGSITTRQIIQIMQESGLGGGREFEFFEDESEFLQKAANVRRALCVMDSSKIARAGLPMRPVEEAVRDAAKNWTAAGA